MYIFVPGGGREISARLVPPGPKPNRRDFMTKKLRIIFGKLANFAKCHLAFFSNFAGLALGCIETDFCE